MKNAYKLISGVFLCLISTIAWGGMFPVMDGALKIMDPFYFTAIRYTSASIIFLILLVIFEGRNALNFKGKILPLWLFGSAGFAGFPRLAACACRKRNIRRMAGTFVYDTYSRGYGGLHLERRQ